MGYLLMKNYHVGASPGRNLLCSCYEKACVEIKCPYSINYTTLCYSNLEYLQLWDRRTLLKKAHQYYTQRMLQMAVTGTIKNYFVVWNPHGIFIVEIYFDNELWCFMKNKFQKNYQHHFKGLLSMGKVTLLSRYFTFWYRITVSVGMICKE